MPKCTWRNREIIAGTVRPSAQEIAELENSLGYALPPPYRAFLLEVNGGTPLASELRTVDGEFHLESLRPLLPDRRSGLWNAITLSRTWCGQGFIPIGYEGTGGGEFVLHASGEVSYRSNDTDAWVRLAGSFDDLWDRLEEE